MTPYFAGTFGNASSVHRHGQEARAALDASRSRIARLLGVPAGELVFTSGGTESDNHALRGVASESRKRGKDHLITSVADHHAVLDTCGALEAEGFRVTRLPVDGQGMVSPADVRGALTPRTALVSIMHANNEVGTVNPIGEIAEITREAGVPFHCDAVQSFGKIPLPSGAGMPDLLSLSAHKIYGPKGMGALRLRREVMVEKLLHGGGQERGFRGGTENVPLAVGFAEAAEAIHGDLDRESARQLALRSRMIGLLTEGLPGVLVNGHPGATLPGILNISFDSRVVSIDGEALLFNLDIAGIAVSSGSACTSGSVAPSHVLMAMGRDRATASASLRFSFGVSTTAGDLEHVAAELKKIVSRIGKAA
jgi:cysteine desulfurase